MGVRVTTIVFVLLVAVLSITVVAAIASAQEAPALPSFYYGKATYNNKDVPVGATVTAKINSETRGAIKVQQAGTYGSNTKDQKLGVSGTKSDLSRDVEFFVKVPGLKEIKATQKAKWIPGNATKLDLTFIGEEIKENLTNQTLAKIRETVVFNSITAGKPAVAFINNPDLPVIRLQLVTLANFTNVTVDFEVVEKLPPSISNLDGSYMYMWISAPKLKETDIKTAIIRFRVPKLWTDKNGLDPLSIRLYRYSNNRWNQLETFHEGTDEFDSYYRSATPGFSYFAISPSVSVARQAANQTVTTQKTEETGKKAEEKPAKVSDQEDTEKKTAGETVSQITGYAVEKVQSNPIIGFMLVLVGIFIGILATYFLAGRRKEEN